MVDRNKVMTLSEIAKALKSVVEDQKRLSYFIESLSDKILQLEQKDRGTQTLPR